MCQYIIGAHSWISKVPEGGRSQRWVRRPRSSRLRRGGPTGAHSQAHRSPTLVLSSTTRSPSADTHRTDFTDFRPIWNGGRQRVWSGLPLLLWPCSLPAPALHSPPSASSQHLHTRASPGTPPPPRGPGTWWGREGRTWNKQSSVIPGVHWAAVSGNVLSTSCVLTHYSASQTCKVGNSILLPDIQVRKRKHSSD